jgi:hypothetical protein
VEAIVCALETYEVNFGGLTLSSIIVLNSSRREVTGEATLVKFEAHGYPFSSSFFFFLSSRDSHCSAKIKVILPL